MSAPIDDEVGPVANGDGPAPPRAHRDVRPAAPRAVLRRARARARQALFGDSPPSTPQAEPSTTTGEQASRDEGSRGPVDDPAAVIRGHSLGRYVILGALGRGGMGTVYKAYDETLDRAVAIKLLRSGTTDHHARRLRREAQALAKLSHPNVVQVYEVGQADGRWFIAMELVPGRTLRQWYADEHDWRECVRVYLQAAQGLGAAHAAGLVHRDFKPDNCIIDDQGRVRVLDFGLVRDTVPASEEHSGADVRAELEADIASPEAPQTSMTRTGTVLGTVAYMPPEQFDGQRADARSDQFSLCVSLYEAVYGERPFAGGSMLTLMEAIQDGRVRPAPRGRTVPSALRSVLLRGLAADPHERWPSMDALLDQLRLRVTPRRRRGMAAGVMVGLVAVGGGVALGQYAQVMDRCTGARAQLQSVWSDAQRQQVEAALLGTERSYAPDTWIRVEQRLDDYARGWAEKHTEVCEATRVTQEQTEQDMGLRMSCLHDRKVALRAAVDVLADADATVAEHAVKLVTGLPGFVRCDDLTALRAVVPPPEDPQVAGQVEALREQMAAITAMQKAGKYPAALERVDAIVEQAETLGYGALIAEARARRGALRDLNGEYPEAEQDLLQAYALAMEQRHDDAARDAASSLNWVVGFRLARHAEGQVWGRVALAHITRAGQDVAPERQAGVLRNIGNVLSSQGKLDEALGHQRRALTIAENALDEHHPVLGPLLDNIGITLARQGKLPEALHHQQRGLAIIEAALGEHHPRVANLLTNMSIVLRMQGKLDEALAQQQRALAIDQQAWGENHPQVGAAWDNIGGVLAMQGKLEEARVHFERGLLIREETLGEHHPDIANSLNNLANVVSDQGDLHQALTFYRRALAINEKVRGQDHADVAGTLNNLGMVLTELGELDQALARLQRALGIYERTVGTEHPDAGSSLNNIGRVLALQGRLDEALTHYQRALAIKQAALGPNHTRVAASLNDIGSLLRAQGKLEEAKAYHQRALAAWTEAFDKDHPELANAVLALALVALDERDFDTARAHAEHAISLRESGEVSSVALAYTRFVLAKALWASPGQRTRARALAQQARDGYPSDGTSDGDQLAEIEGWLAEHPVP